MRLFRRKVPVVLQSNAVECGAATLSMICQYHGINVSLEDVADVLRPGRGGTSATDIYKAAGYFGLEVEAYSIEPSALDALKMPALVHWEFNHFVILEKWSDAKATIVDPAYGRKSMSAEAFSKGFTGVILTFSKKVGYQQPVLAERKKSLKSFLGATLKDKSFRRILLFGLLASMVLQLSGLALPLTSKLLIDTVIPENNDVLLPALGIGIVVMIFSKGLLVYMRSLLLLHLQVKFDTTTTTRVFAHLLALPYNFFQMRTSGDLISRLGSTTTIRNLFTGQFASTIIDGCLVITYFVLLLWVEPVLAYLALVLAVCEISLIIATSSQARETVRESLTSAAHLQAYQVEAIKGIATLKASGTEDQVFSQWNNLFGKNLHATFRKDYFMSVVAVLKNIIQSLSPLLLLWLGTYQVINGQLELGTMIAINALAISFLTPLNTLTNTILRLQEARVHLDRVFKITGTPVEQADGEFMIPALKGAIDIQDVWFRYNQNDDFVLKEIGIKIKPGTKVAIVGKTGAGKSTLGMLLVGLFLPEKGTIHYDDLHINSIHLKELRRQVGVVLQEPFLFSGSIRQNIAFNNPEIDLEEVIKAAKMAAIHEEIGKMPLGYDTLISEGGSSLSGGQIQRIALARALAQQPVIMLLDEATSHLDAGTEYQIDQMLHSLNCTRIFIAHRLSTVVNADQIIYMDEGRVIGSGSHKEMLETNADYAELFARQFGDHREAERFNS